MDRLLQSTYRSRAHCHRQLDGGSEPLNNTRVLSRPEDTISRTPIDSSGGSRLSNSNARQPRPGAGAAKDPQDGLRPRKSPHEMVILACFDTHARKSLMKRSEPGASSPDPSPLCAGRGERSPRSASPHTAPRAKLVRRRARGHTAARMRRVATRGATAYCPCVGRSETAAVG